MTKEERKRKIEKALDVDFTGMTRQEVEKYALKAAEQSVLNEAEADHWRELYQREVNRKYGRSRDTADIDYAQLSFFNEAEAEADPAVPEPSAQEIKGKPKKSRKKKGHQKKALPVHVTEYRLSGDEMNCPNCGSELHEMKKIIHEEIIVEPARFHIERTVTHVYSCRNCDNTGLGGTIINAPSPKSFMPGSALSASLAAWIIYRKYAEGTPLYRQSQSLARFGMDISRQTLSNWVVKSADRYGRPLYERLKEYLIRNDILHADETTLQVVRGREKDQQTSKPEHGYMWLYRTGKYAREPIVIYEYCAGRRYEYPEKFLERFSGYLQTDGYAVYQKLAKDDARKAGTITPVGCWAHLQRKFCDAKKAAGKEVKTPTIDVALAFFRELNHVEKACADMSIEDRKAYRKEHAEPILNDFFSWLHEKNEIVVHDSLLGKAFTYGINQEFPLRNYLLDGRLEMTNNLSERSIKGYVICRKNFLFANTENGAQSSAILYSILETAKANHLNCYEYLKYVLETLSQIDAPTEEDLDRLLPWSDTLPEKVTTADTEAE